MDYAISLKEHGLKATPQRLEIINIMLEYGHITKDRLYEKLKQKFPSLSLATVYKNINLMSEKTFVSEVKIPNQKSVYELTKAEHSHLVCKKCHNIFDIELDLSSIKKQTLDKTSFQVDFTSMTLNGLCKECQDNML